MTWTLAAHTYQRTSHMLRGTGALPLAALCAVLAPAAYASPALPRFEEANRLYEEARYELAAEAYQELARQRPYSAALHYNLGNAYFRQGAPGSLGRAIASYWRAFELDPRDGDVRHNLDFALQRAGESLIPPGVPKALFAAFQALSRRELAALQWLGLWAALLLGSLHLLREDLRGRLRPWLTSAVAAWACCAAWWGLRSAYDIPSPAVVVAPEAEVRSGPGRNFPVSFKVPEGRRVSRLDGEDGWVEIGVLKEGLKGWIEARDLEEI